MPPINRLSRLKRELKRAFNIFQTGIGYMRVAHGRPDVLMAQKLLHIAYIHPVLKQMRGKAVAQRMKSCRLAYTDPPQTLIKNLLRRYLGQAPAAFARKNIAIGFFILNIILHLHEQLLRKNR